MEQGEETHTHIFTIHNLTVQAPRILRRRCTGCNGMRGPQTQNYTNDSRLSFSERNIRVHLICMASCCVWGYEQHEASPGVRSFLVPQAKLMQGVGLTHHRRSWQRFTETVTCMSSLQGLLANTIPKFMALKPVYGLLWALPSQNLSLSSEKTQGLQLKGAFQ